MRKLVMSIGAAAVLAFAGAFAPTSSHAAVNTGAAALQGKVEQSSLADNVAFICRWRPWGRTCFWGPGPYAAYGFVGPRWHRWGWRHGWGWRRHWW